MSDRPRVSAARTGALSLAGVVFANPIYRLTLAGRTPCTLPTALPSSWPGDRAVAEAALDKVLLVAGQAHAMTPIADADLRLGPRAAAALHCFSWLLDVRALGTRAARVCARARVGEWIDANRGWSSVAWRPDLIGRRLSAWLTAADIMIADADDPFAAKVSASVAAQARHLARFGEPPAGTLQGLAVSKGRLAAALAMGIGDPEQRLAAFCQAADQRILPDGGPAERSPTALLKAVRDLLDVRGWLQAAQMEVPEALTAAVARAIPTLRLLRLGDGRLAGFHGGTEGDSRRIEAVLARSGIRGDPALEAPTSGFQRLAANGTIVVVDVGPPPRPIVNGDGHAGTLAFEASFGDERLIVNAGSIVGDNEVGRRALRETAAHSTVVVDEASSTRLRRNGELDVPEDRVTVERRDQDGATWLDASYPGYRRRFDLVHRRRLYLGAAGNDLRGEDVLDGHGKATFVVIFHLHPNVDASQLEDGTSVLLRTASGAGWKLSAAGGTVYLRDGVWYGACDVPKRAQRIVVKGRTDGHGARVRWALRREGDG